MTIRLEYIGISMRYEKLFAPRGEYRYVKGRGEHIVIAERVFGRKIPKRAHVHHVNGDRGDNRNENLVICQDTAYHHLLHVQTRALDACGHARWRRCLFCRGWCPVGHLFVSPYRGSTFWFHWQCLMETRRGRAHLLWMDKKRKRLLGRPADGSDGMLLGNMQQQGPFSTGFKSGSIDVAQRLLDHSVESCVDVVYSREYEASRGAQT